ncbi:MAG: polyprenyl diphosphate synthase [Candidatus Woesearchaeota archaeon]
MVLEKLQKITENIPYISKKEESKEYQDEEEFEKGMIVKTPQHLAMTMEGTAAYCRKSGEDKNACYKKNFTILRNLLLYQVKISIPVLTVNVIPESMKKDTENYNFLLDSLVEFLESLSKDEAIHKNKIKVSVFGKWYNLPGKVIDAIKTIVEETKDYDSFFLNLCVNYEGQEEIVDSCKLIARQVKAEKINPENISKNLIKENCYSSYFIPPDLIIKTGLKRVVPSTLLWDSPNVKIYFADKHWPELKIADLNKALRQFQG